MCLRKRGCTKLRSLQEVSLYLPRKTANILKGGDGRRANLRVLKPPPAPEFLKHFCLNPGLEQKLLLRRTWSDEKPLPLQLPEPSNHRNINSSKFASFVQEQGFTLNSPTSSREKTFGCGFFPYSWKLPAYSGAFLLTIDNFSFLYLQLELLCLQF